MRIGRLKVTPVLETGLTIEYDPEKHPIDKPCHLHLRWAVEKCPRCRSALMIYYAPTDKHESGMGVALPDEKHKVIVSCIKCGIIGERF